MTLDQLLAPRLSAGMSLQSLELTTNSRGTQTHCKFLSWRGAGMPLGAESEPREVFARLFGYPNGDQRRSVLDLVFADARRMRSNLGSADQERLDEYLESVRALERQIDSFERRSRQPRPPQMAILDRPPERLPEYVRLMSDLLIVALQTDQTRAITYALGDDTSTGWRTLIDMGVDPTTIAIVVAILGNARPGTHTADHHTLAHGALPLVELIDRWYVEQASYVLQRMHAIQEGKGTLLDHSIVVYGTTTTGRGSPGHGNKDVDCVVAGKGGGLLPRPGRAIRFPDGTPLCNLWLTVLQLAGIERRQFGFSTGTLPGLA